MSWYNENNEFAAAWLRNLIAGGYIESGRVDVRSIQDVQFFDVPKRAHFFAGIGVWSRALRVAGWPDSVPVWTGSCPCQPFSSTGKRRGFADDRHLWPEWFRLIRECNPSVVFGEQVAGPDGLKWFDLVSSDLEREGYAVGAADTCAAGSGAPHIRQRLYFMAYSRSERRDGINSLLCRGGFKGREDKSFEASGCSSSGFLAHSDEYVSRQGGSLIERDLGSNAQSRSGLGGCGSISELGKTNEQGLQRWCECGDGGNKRTTRPAGLAHFWSDGDWISCQDGKFRTVEPGAFPLANGVASRVGRLRAYGNAIVLWQAVAFIRAAMSALDLYALLG